MAAHDGDAKAAEEAQPLLLAPAPPAYIAATPMVVAPQPPTEEWRTSLLGCCADPHAANVTMRTICCPCITYGSNRDRMMHQAVHGMPHPTQGDSCSSTCSAYALLLALPHGAGGLATGALRMLQRTQLRLLYGIRGSALGDCCTGFLCGACSEIQIRRELDLREQEGALRLGGEDTVIVVVEEPVKEDVAPPQYSA